MGKYIIAVILGILSSQLRAESCWPIYEKEAKKIAEKSVQETTVGNHFYLNQDNLHYWPGTTIKTAGPNWVNDFTFAIKWGPSFYKSSNDPRLSWLQSLEDSIKSDCMLEDKNFESLRAMMKDLMDDGSFCPQGKILKLGAFQNKSKFKKVLKAAVSDGRFAHYCDNKSLSDDSFREVKDADKPKSKHKESSQTQAQ